MHTFEHDRHNLYDLEKKVLRNNNKKKYNIPKSSTGSIARDVRDTSKSKRGHIMWTLDNQELYELIETFCAQL